MNTESQAKEAGHLPGSLLFRRTLRFIFGSLGLTIVALCAFGALSVGPSACLILIREWSSRCGTPTMAAYHNLVMEGAEFTLGAFVGSFICRRSKCLPRVARYLAIVTVTTSATCYVLGFFVLPAMVRFVR
jgi:hypothetical protein